MSKPFGQWLVGIAGAILIVVGVAHIIKGVKEKFRRRMTIPPEHQNWAVPLCKFGLIARAVVFFIIGGFMIVAAYRANPEEAKGMQEALRFLQDQAYGPWLLGGIGLGLIAFAVYSVLESMYRRIDTSEAA